MKHLSPAEMAVLKAWHDYVHSHRPSYNRENESDNDTIDRVRLFYLMTEILYEYYQVAKVRWFSYQALRMMGVDSGTFSRWRKQWVKVWLSLRF